MDELRRAQSQLPVEVRAAEARAEAARETVAAQRKALEDAETRHRACERDLQDAEARKSKFQAQAPLVKTNAEYTALLQQIEGTEALVSDLETRILEALEEVDSGAGALRHVEQEQGEHERVALQEAKELRARLEEVSAKLETQEAERAQLVSVLPADTRARYERVCKSGALGTSFIVGRSCGRCHRDVPFQTINLVHAGELQHCGNCGRILIETPEA